MVDETEHYLFSWSLMSPAAPQGENKWRYRQITQRRGFQVHKRLFFSSLSLSFSLHKQLCTLQLLRDGFLSGRDDGLILFQLSCAVLVVLLALFVSPSTSHYKLYVCVFITGAAQLAATKDGHANSTTCKR